MKHLKKYIYLVVVLATLFVSCRTLDVAMKDVSIGMSKEQVVKILGKNYEIVHSSLTPDEDILEVFDYVVIGASGEAVYKIYFLNGILNRWDKEWIEPAVDVLQIVHPT